MVLPRNRARTELIFAYYKVVVDAPCTVALRVIDPQQREIRGNWRYSIGQSGPVQGVWALHTGLFKEAGLYRLELREESEGSEPHTLASTRLVVELEGK
jgi:hypothetical protein